VIVVTAAWIVVALVRQRLRAGEEVIESTRGHNQAERTYLLVATTPLGALFSRQQPMATDEQGETGGKRSVGEAG
jgi:flagellar biosynthesis/type III secretory pathway ATPase